MISSINMCYLPIKLNVHLLFQVLIFNTNLQAHGL